jgi:hypothetical protein
MQGRDGFLKRLILESSGLFILRALLLAVFPFCGALLLRPSCRLACSQSTDRSGCGLLRALAAASSAVQFPTVRQVLRKRFLLFSISGCLAKGCFASVRDGWMVVCSLETAYIFKLFE